MSATDRNQPKEDGARLKKIPVGNLVIGMYVAGLDKPWLETSFALQGFYLRTDAAIQRISDICEYVYVDPRRYDTNAVDRRQTEERRRKQVRQSSEPHAQLRPTTPFPHEESTELKDELEPASLALADAVAVVDQCLSQLSNDGQLDAKAMHGVIKPIVASVMRNKEAVAALVRMRSMDNYTYSHAISCSVWAAVLGKELGYPPEEIETLAFGCALLDVGKTRLPGKLLAQSAPLTDGEWKLIKQHVDFGLEIAVDAGLTDITIGNIIKTHHERFDGSGYPNGLANANIPIFGRIAGLVDSYDAMISKRPYKSAQSSYEALLELERAGDTLFQKELVQYFIWAIGIFPVGCLVELNTGEVGVVVKQHVDRRLRPKIMLILNERKLPRSEFTIIDLGAQTGGDSSQTLWIRHELPKDSHGIDASEYFL